jgi:hypothetical protein
MDLKQNGTGLLGATYISPANVQLPKNVDWRTSGKFKIVTKIVLTYCENKLF